MINDIWSLTVFYYSLCYCVAETDIQRMLGVYGLKLDNLDIRSEMRFGYEVQINFQDCTLRSQDAHMTKKDAKRKLYLEFAKALSLGESNGILNENMKYKSKQQQQ